MVVIFGIWQFRVKTSNANWQKKGKKKKNSLFDEIDSIEGTWTTWRDF